MKFTLYLTSVISLMLALLPHALWVVGWLLSKCCHFRLPYPPFGWTALGLVLLCWGLMAYGHFVGCWQQRVNHVAYSTAQLPAAFDGYKIVHISDLHLHTFISHPQHLQRIVDSINAQRPNLICFTGDLVSYSSHEGSTLVPILQQLHATDGIVSVLGNHDFFIYGNRSQSERDQELAQLISFQQDTLGWQLLRNRHLTLSRGQQSITLVGIDNSNGSGQGFSTINRGDLTQAMQGTQGFRILLSHDPSFWQAEVVDKAPIALTLSGHTHAAQVRFFGWSPASLMFRQSAGLYRLGSQALYVTAGIGCTVPFRINCPSEITVIELKK